MIQSVTREALHNRAVCLASAGGRRSRLRAGGDASVEAPSKSARPAALVRELHTLAAAQVYADELGNAGLLHGHAVERICDLHRPRVVRDHEELRAIADLTDHLREAPDVRFVQGRVDFVEDADGAGAQ